MQLVNMLGRIVKPAVKWLMVPPKKQAKLLKTLLALLLKLRLKARLMIF